MTEDERKRIEEFAAVAQRYCAWAELDNIDKQTVLDDARILFVELHYFALKLPELGFGDSDQSDKVTEGVSTTAIEQKFVSLLPEQIYWEVLNPWDHEVQDLGCGLLTEDFASIYGDLKQGLMYFDANELCNACHYWRDTMGFHWLGHLTSALNAIQKKDE